MKRVREKILKLLPGRLAAPGIRIVDLPCGRGPLLRDLRAHYPQASLSGVDIEKHPEAAAVPGVEFHARDFNKPLELPGEFDAAISVSGVMEFDNTAVFLKEVHRHLRPGGLFVVTNDSIQTLRDRISFLLLGKYSRYALYLQPGFVTYKSMPAQELHKLVEENGFKIDRIEFVVTMPEDWIFLPLALPVYLLQKVYSFIEKSPMPMEHRRRLFPLKALVARHYVIFATKNS
jgi:SAM-dependent methyltransferase